MHCRVAELVEIYAVGAQVREAGLSTEPRLALRAERAEVPGEDPVRATESSAQTCAAKQELIHHFRTVGSLAMASLTFGKLSACFKAIQLNHSSTQSICT